jgi:hypothetical protein
MHATPAVVEGQSAVAGRDLRIVLQRGVSAHRSGPGAESVKGDALVLKEAMERVRELEAELAELRDEPYTAKLLTRAEKAEAECERHIKTLIVTEARVAELLNRRNRLGGDDAELKGED